MKSIKSFQVHVSELFFSSTRITMRKKFTEKMNIQNVIAIIIIIYGIVFGTLSMHFQQQKKMEKVFAATAEMSEKNPLI